MHPSRGRVTGCPSVLVFLGHPISHFPEMWHAHLNLQPFFKQNIFEMKKRFLKINDGTEPLKGQEKQNSIYICQKSWGFFLKLS